MLQLQIILEIIDVECSTSTFKKLHYLFSETHYNLLPQCQEQYSFEVNPLLARTRSCNPLSARTRSCKTKTGSL